MFSEYKGSTFENSFWLKLDRNISGLSTELSFKCKVAGRWLLDLTTWLEQMKDVRDSHKEMYFSRFPASIGSLSSYLAKGPIENPNQILFLIVDQQENLFGHVGLKLDSSGKVNIDNVLKIAKGSPGIMMFAIQEILTWGHKNLDISEYRLQVISTNHKAIALYEQLGFTLHESVSLRIENLPNGVTNLIPFEEGICNTSEKMLIMKLEL